jgi:hypothetical protein
MIKPHDEFRGYTVVLENIDDGGIKTKFFNTLLNLTTWLKQNDVFAIAETTSPSFLCSVENFEGETCRSQGYIFRGGPCVLPIFCDGIIGDKCCDSVFIAEVNTLRELRDMAIYQGWLCNIDTGQAYCPKCMARLW